MMRLIFTMFVVISFNMAFGQNSLPAWFFNPPRTSSSCHYTIGISDPGLNKQEALKQAESRAIFTFMLLNEKKISASVDESGNSILESFTNSIIKEKYPDLFFEVIKTYFTDNNEAILLLKTSNYILPADIKKDSVNIRGVVEYYFSEMKNSRESKLEYVFKTELSNKTIQTDYFHSLTKMENGVETTTLTSNFEYTGMNNYGKKETIIKDDLHYLMFENKENQTDNPLYPISLKSSNSLKRGIWNAYIHALVYETNKHSGSISSDPSVNHNRNYTLHFALDGIAFHSDSLELRLLSSGALNEGTSFFTQIKYDNIDLLVPRNEVVNPNRFALIIGNEDYSSYQSGLNSEINVGYAKNDARVFLKYAQNVLGIPEENISLLIDAKAIELNRAINKLCLYAKNSFGKAEIYFYYAGHGLPDESTKESCIIPVDVSGSDLQYAMRLNDLYKKLTEYPSKSVTVILDACFSGGARNQGLVEARGVKIVPKEGALPGKLVVFAASSGEQSSMSYDEKKHGLFTYYLLKKLNETKGDITYEAMSKYLQEQIGIASIRVNNKEQNPQTNVSPFFEEEWKMLKFNQ